MFAHYAIAYRSVDLDSVEYQKDNRGGDIRNALRERTGMVTIPQIFVGGEFVGGCTETFDAFNDGRLGELLAKANVAMGPAERRDAYSFLPAWLHPRAKQTAA
jgi:cysteine synthase A